MSRLLLWEVAPELVVELRDYFVELGENELASQAHSLVIAELCGCGDSFCGSFHAVPRKPAGVPRRGQREQFAPRLTELHVDVVDGRIVYVEILYQDELKAKIHAAVAGAELDEARDPASPT